MARTAVVAGTASAVNGRVQRRQAERFAERDANIYAQREQAYDAATAPPQSTAPAQSSPSSSGDRIAQLQQLAQLRDQGVLSSAEFEAEKAKIIAG
jgi:hypothetical protein